MGVYLDHAATTPMRPEAIEAMVPFLGDAAGLYGNPSGSHALARAARRALDDARDVVAEACGAPPGGVVFTSGGTEADNQAVAGVLARAGGVAVCSAVEHHAVLEVVHHHGGRVVEVTADGRVDLAALAAALGPEVALVSVMTVNNETGVIQPIDAVAELVRERAPGALVHTDAVQAFPWLDVASVTAAADLVSLSAHKFGGPKGVGALVVRNGATPAPLLRGGGQELDRRSGTPNVAGAVAMAAAARVTAVQRAATVVRVAALRDRLLGRVLTALPDARATVPAGTPTVAGIAHLCFPGVESEELLFLLDQAEVCASAAASCASGAMEASHVLAAMGIATALARGSLRLSLGWSTTAADVDRGATAVIDAVTRLRHGARPPAAVR